MENMIKALALLGAAAAIGWACSDLLSAICRWSDAWAANERREHAEKIKQITY